ncbi:NADPH:quinone reductase or related Zn-dependent oxidoreductase (Qor) (PDB:2VCY) [Commensalibacter communis]|uniref:NADPH:quinone reductase or related Zn-dependent oxidoreductase (Qor) n=1 Tax=Commensalibacter communis TaxID=2972786 RepID=A0A9W4X664_9PROT|nr:NAD(P)H-quinone oxidoreductase [Commensalibacter communis]CAI3929370.1 NADPH:quinone reductase or related Zn-dependent oxidoreductase (Qor) (PDB:2VCY) [Commensalibacter communis]CAI3930899.1 NADPH:quinone reductase or related Zn-dependent oxidoreductase (Qor) (PDB:2VCY) [Commensalibacter communis]CAI3931588.1 NADPH:quinone reductase or related Zn-dependent oxidoreductase (Qor) (PDB:2VCY) [Commensalibacter communis]CAI3932120.1 NADPH:quinone reductase or related Zn-dependent oxidoreductase (Q
MNTQQMKAIIVQNPGGPEELALSTLPIPTCKEGEILVRVLAAGINRPDIMQRKGLYPPPEGASPLLGLEIAGEVVSAPSASIFKPGDHVCALTNGGGYAEYCAVPEQQCLPWPKDFTVHEAAALSETFFTVWTNLFEIGKLTAGETVLIHGGSGGIGTAAIQLASNFGATVYTTVGSKEKGELCKRLGAKDYINYTNEDFVERIHELTNKQGVHIILDIMAAAYFNQNINVLSEDGRLVIISFQGGIKANDVNLAKIVTKRLTVSGSTLRPRSNEFKGHIAKELYHHVWPLLSSRKISPLIHQIFPLSEVRKAHEIMEAGHHSGKMILDLSNL